MRSLESGHPSPEGPTAMRRAQLLDAQTQLQAARRDKHLTKMLKGVVTHMHCLMMFQADLLKDLPKACALEFSPLL